MSCDLSAVVLVGIPDFGRYTLRSLLPQALWPVGGKTIIQWLIEDLAGQGIQQVIICVGGDLDSIQSSVTEPEGIEISFLSQEFERGSAGCLFDAAQKTGDDRLLLCQSNLIRIPDLSGLIETHEKAGADVTMALCPDGTSGGQADDMAAGGLTPFVLCNRAILETVPSEGYCDFNEALLPQLIREGRKVHSFRLTEPVGNFYGWQSYLDGVGRLLELSVTKRPSLRSNPSESNVAGCRSSPLDLGDPIIDRPDVWAGREVEIHQTAQIIGPLVLSDQVRIAEKSVIIGPCVLGPNTTVGTGSVISGSVTWNGVGIESNCRIANSVLTHQVHVGRESIIEEQLVLRQSALEKHPKEVTRMVDKLKESLGLDRIGKGSVFEDGKSILTRTMIAGLLLVTVAFVWAYWNPTLATLWARLTQSDEYSSGLLVPLIAIYVVWIRREELRAVPIVPALGLGLLAFAVAQAARFVGLYLGMDSGENLSVILTVWAILLMLLGWRMIWKIKAILLFLLLTLPLPGQVQGWITLPLQRWATSSAVFSLEAMGYAVQQQGNIIDINGTQVGVAEACNGLRMVTAFFVIAGFVALIIRRSAWQKIVIFVSSVPIALICNTIRLAITTIAFTMIQATTWEKAFHDFGGLAMMPLALAMIVAELWILSRIVMSDSDRRPETIVIRR